MTPKKAAVLDIGSDCITLVIQDNKYADNFIFKASAAYDGFMDGEFFDVSALFRTVDGLFRECATVTNAEVAEVLVGVPGEFTTVVCKNVEMTFTPQHKVTPRDLEALFQKGNTYGESTGYISINASPVHYILDTGEKTIDPVNKTTSSLVANISYVLCEIGFVNLFNRIASQVGANFTYTSQILAEAMYVVPPAERDKGVVLFDAGFISSTVAFVRGDGIKYAVSFSIGGGNVAGDLTAVEQIPFDQAKDLTAKLNLNLRPKEGDVYNVTYEGEVCTYPVSVINEIAVARVQDIAEIVQKIIERAPCDIPPSAKILLTGCGLSTLAGAKEILSDTTRRVVEVIAPDLQQFNKPRYSSLAGLLKVQQQHLAYNKMSLLEIIKSFFNNRRKS